MSNQSAHLVLEDGKIFSGLGFGYQGQSSGEVVFNTAMSGYQEVLTDPSYCGQVVVMTYPEIGNYGINPVDVESKKIFLSGFIIKELSPIVSNYRAKQSLDDYLKESKIPGIQGIDTRSLVRYIRDKGAMQAYIVFGDLKKAKTFVKKASKLPSMEGQDLASQVSTTKTYKWSKGNPNILKSKVQNSAPDPYQGKRFKVIAYDFGIKQNILRRLYESGCEVQVVPANYPAEKVIKQNPDGIFLSNGPGDPAACVEIIENIKKLIDKKIPLFGICLGHQILSLALGLKSFKLKFGHHGSNQPVMDHKTGEVEISSQNHGFAINDKKLPTDIKVTHVNLNDQTVEGIEHKKYPLFSVQYHPEASPGPHDSDYLFQRFVDLMKKHKRK